MRKYIIGGLVGFMLATAVSANAEGVTKMIGEVIDGSFNVKVNGVELSDQAIVVQGTSYLPVRSFGEATGYDIKFDPNMGIEMTKKSDAPVPSQKSVKEQIDDLNVKIKELQNGIETTKNLKQVNEDSLNNPIIPKDEVKKVIAELDTNIAELETKLTDYQSQLSALQAQQ